MDYNDAQRFSFSFPFSFLLHPSDNSQELLDSALLHDLSPPKRDQVRVVILYIPPTINFVSADKSQPKAEHVPNSYTEALSSPQSKQWLLSMQEQFDALKEQGTWTEVPRNDVPDGQKILIGKWVYDIKVTGRYKSRWVVRGFQQQLDP